MSQPLRDRTLALAGLFQAARLAQQLAREGRAESAAFYASIQSILMLDAENIEEVYGGVGGLTLGLEIVRDKLAARTEAPYLEIAKYAIGLIHLTGQLMQHPEMQQAIRRGAETAEAQMKFFESSEDGENVHPNLVEKLAELYAQTISTLSPRIMVNGDHGHLSNPAIAAKVRAALLAGIRSAYLWRQKGGSRLELLLRRKRIAQEAGKLLEGLRES